MQSGRGSERRHIHSRHRRTIRGSCILTIRKVLRRDRVEQLRADGDAEVGQVAEKLTSLTETLVDLERAIDVGVIDESLPANGSAGFLSHIEINHRENRKMILG